MLKVFGWRLVSVLPILFGVSVVSFLLMRLVPGDLTLALLGPFATEERAAALRELYGLDKPIVVQYWRWLAAVASGDFGISVAHRVPVAGLLLDRVENSAILTAAATLIAVVAGTLGGVFAAVKRHSLYDRVTTSLALVLASAPTFWFGILLLYIFAIKLRWFPAIGMYSFGKEGQFTDLLWHLPLPALSASLISFAVIFRLCRSGLLDILEQDYIRAARARGLSESRVICRHALRSLLPPIVNISGLQIGFIFGSALFAEVIFQWPGIGMLLYTGILSRDVPVIQAVLVVIAAVFIVANLMTDLVMAALDPKARSA